MQFRRVGILLTPRSMRLHSAIRSDPAAFVLHLHAVLVGGWLGFVGCRGGVKLAAEAIWNCRCLIAAALPAAAVQHEQPL